jgi:hypothetical protein
MTAKVESTDPGHFWSIFSFVNTFNMVGILLFSAWFPSGVQAFHRHVPSNWALKCTIELIGSWAARWEMRITVVGAKLTSKRALLASVVGQKNIIPA